MADFSRSLWSIAMADVESGHPSRMKRHLAYLAIGERKTRIVDAEEDWAPLEHTPLYPDRTDPTPASAVLQTNAH